MAVRRVARVLGWTLIGASLLIFAFLGYQLFVTDLIAKGSQQQASRELDHWWTEVRTTLPSPQIVTTSIPTLPQIVLYPEEPVDEGKSFARILIPSLEVDEVVFEGVGRKTLKKGPGHMPSTPLPGQPGNAVISGHRTTYGRPFYDLNELAPGDLIQIETAIGIHSYQVRESLLVKPTDVWVTEERAGSWLTLTTCHPRYSAKQRLIIVAELVEGPNFEYAQVVLAAA